MEERTKDLLMEKEVVHDEFLVAEDWDAVLLGQQFTHLLLLFVIIDEDSWPADPLSLHDRVALLQIEQVGVQDAL